MTGIVADNFLMGNDFWEVLKAEFLDPASAPFL
jgi:hypothetical protein